MHYFSPLNTFIRIGKDPKPDPDPEPEPDADPDPYLWLMDLDPDPGCPKTCGSCGSGSGSPTLIKRQEETPSSCWRLVWTEWNRTFFVFFFSQIFFLLQVFKNLFPYTYTTFYTASSAVHQIRKYQEKDARRLQNMHYAMRSSKLWSTTSCHKYLCINICFFVLQFSWTSM